MTAGTDVKDIKLVNVGKIFKKMFINEEYMGDHGHYLNECKMNAETISQKSCLVFLMYSLTFTYIAKIIKTDQSSRNQNEDSLN